MSDLQATEVGCTLCGRTPVLGASFVEYSPGRRAYFCHPATAEEREPGYSCLELVTHAGRLSVPPREYNRERYQQAARWVVRHNVYWL